MPAKPRGGPSYGKCAAQDELTPILKEIVEADAHYSGLAYLLWNSFRRDEIIHGAIAVSLSEVQRLRPETLFPRKIHTGLIYAMNVTEQVMNERGYRNHIVLNEDFLRRMFGTAETLCCFDTYQFDDYSKMVAERYNVEEKAAKRKQVFPQDCEKAFQMGARFASTVVA